MKLNVQGIHHITAIASDPQATVDFYTQVLGLRLVKKSVNQDDVQTYHFFFGDKTGEPGMDLTFFTFQPIMQGMQGLGQVTIISLAVPENSLSFWKKRFEEKGVDHDRITTRWDKPRLAFYDKDNQQLELVGVSETELKSAHSELWTTSEISEAVAIHYFYSATLSVPQHNSIEPVLTTALGYSAIEKTNMSTLLKAAGNNTRAIYLEIVANPLMEQGINAAGTVHHIAFQVKDEAGLLTIRDQVIATGLYPTEVINRYYFKSVYFRTRSGILCELATAGPGFTVDEGEKDLGKKLALPPFLEYKRKEIEKNLTPITLKD